MQAFLSKIKQNRKFAFFALIMVFFPSVTLALGVFEGGVVWLVDSIRGIAASIFYFSGLIFDNLLNISLSTSLFENSFIKVAWSNIRDLANVGFILGAIYIAFSMMFNFGKWQNSLIKLIIVIFVINFSLFFSRVIVDAGNITARVFMTSISVNIIGTEDYFAAAKAFYPGSKDADFQSVGAAFVLGLSPENLLGAKNFEDWQKINSTQTGKSKADSDLSNYLLMQIILIIFFIVFAKHLFVGGFMFLGRMVYIVYYMIAAPAFFITAFIPGQENIWKSKWLIPLFQKSFCIVIYLFFLWLSLIILNAGLIQNMTGSGFMANLGIFIIKAVFVLKMLSIGNDLGKKWCEEGNSTLGAVFGAVGAVGKVIPVGRAFSAVTRTATGTAGASIKNSEYLKNLQSRGGLTGWTAKQVRLKGEDVAGMKIGGQSFKEQQKKLLARESEARDGLSEEQKDRMDRVHLQKRGASKEDKKAGKIDQERISGFTDDVKDKRFKTYDNEESMMLWKRSEKEMESSGVLEAMQAEAREKAGEGAKDEDVEKAFDILKAKETEKLYETEKRKWDRKSEEVKKEELDKNEEDNPDYNEDRKGWAEGKKQKLVDDSKASELVLNKDEVPAGSLFRAILPAARSHSDRVSEDQEENRAKVKSNVRKEKEQEKMKLYKEEATEDKNAISEGLSGIENMVKFSKENEGALETAMSEMNIGDKEERKTLLGIYDKISKLTDIEKEKKAVDSLSDFGKKDSVFLKKDVTPQEAERFGNALKKSGMTNDKVAEIREKFEKGTGVDAKEMREILQGASGKLSDREKATGTSRKEQESILRTNIGSIGKTKNSDIDAELKFREAYAKAEADKEVKDMDELSKGQHGGATTLSDITAKGTGQGSGTTGNS